MGGKPFVILMVTLCVWAGHSESSPALSPLRQALRRSVRATPRIDPAACIDNSQCASTPNVCTEDADLGAALCPAMCGACVCEDNLASQGNCSTLIPDICKGDFGNTLCPKSCGICGSPIGSCYDHVTGISCADLPDPCNDELGRVACPKFCGFCTDDATTTTSAPVTNMQDVCSKKPCLNNGICSPAKNMFGFTCSCISPFTGTICESRPALSTTAQPSPGASTQAPTASGVCAQGPCLNKGVCSLASNSFGFVCACPSPYTGTICESKPDPTTTISATTQAATTGNSQTTQAPSTGSCPTTLKDQNSLPCQEGEIIFLIEYSYKDSTNSIDHEGDFVKELVDAWSIKDTGIRFGVVIYHDTVSETIHITDYKDDPDGLKNRISRLTRGLRPSGSADLAKALDYVRQNSFKNARPDAVKVAIPIIHQMTDATKNNIIPAAQRLKDSCVSVVGVAVEDDSLDYDILYDAVSQPKDSFYSYHRSFYDMENTAKWVHYYYPGCHNGQQANRDSLAGLGDATTTSASTTQRIHNHNHNHNHQTWDGDNK